MIEAWKKFFGTGWLHGQEPSKQDCFKAGYEAAMGESQPFQEFKEDGTFTSEGYKRRLKAGKSKDVEPEPTLFEKFAGYTPSEILKIINQWKEKFDE